MRPPKLDVLTERLWPLALGAFFLYWNVAAFLHVAQISPASKPSVLLHLFSMFDMFDRWSQRTYGFEGRAIVLRGPKENLDVRTVDFDLYRYFPQVRGEANRRMNLMSFAPGSDRRDRAYAELAEQLKRLHHHDHPDEDIRMLNIYRVSWPSDPRGYQARYEEREREPMTRKVPVDEPSPGPEK